MRIGIIGAGNIGGTLTRRLTALGHDVSVANSRGPQTLAGLAAETGAKAVSVADAARGKDVVVVTIPEKNVAKKSRVIVETMIGVVKTKRRPAFSDSRGGSGGDDAERTSPDVFIFVSVAITAENEIAFRR